MDVAQSSKQPRSHSLEGNALAADDDSDVPVVAPAPTASPPRPCSPTPTNVAESSQQPLTLPATWMMSSSSKHRTTCNAVHVSKHSTRLRRKPGVDRMKKGSGRCQWKECTICNRRTYSQLRHKAETALLCATVPHQNCSHPNPTPGKWHWCHRCWSGTGCPCPLPC